MRAERTETGGFMKIRTFESRDTEKIFTLWNSAHPYAPLTKELMTKKSFPHF